ncbi:hypothetical protein KFK09_000895 [Dendrobium nobile]|uniref:Uncharacterized protein n=1 Tax=Dendrobium nobile TaxID=94219 RepID=A0A8T3CD52_DENNO|nr:hypothetical protein KFK09_000895 [Dendrobium nobile]
MFVYLLFWLIVCVLGCCCLLWLVRMFIECLGARALFLLFWFLSYGSRWVIIWWRWRWAVTKVVSSSNACFITSCCYQSWRLYLFCWSRLVLRGCPFFCPSLALVNTFSSFVDCWRLQIYWVFKLCKNRDIIRSERFVLGDMWKRHFTVMFWCGWNLLELVLGYSIIWYFFYITKFFSWFIYYQFNISFLRVLCRDISSLYFRNLNDCKVLLFWCLFWLFYFLHQFCWKTVLNEIYLIFQFWVLFLHSLNLYLCSFCNLRIKNHRLLARFSFLFHCSSFEH